MDSKTGLQGIGKFINDSMEEKMIWRKQIIKKFVKLIIIIKFQKHSLHAKLKLFINLIIAL